MKKHSRPGSTTRHDFNRSRNSHSHSSSAGNNSSNIHNSGMNSNGENDKYDGSSSVVEHGSPEQGFSSQQQKAIIEHLLITKNSAPKKDYSHVPCKFFVQGNCQAGDSCPFSHDLNSAVSEQTCKYFQKGNCKFGMKCANAHVLPNGTRLNPRRSSLPNAANSNSSSNPNSNPNSNSNGISNSVSNKHHNSGNIAAGSARAEHMSGPGLAPALPAYRTTFTTISKQQQQQQQQQQQDIRYSNNIPSYKSDSPHFSSPQDHQGSQAEHIQVKKNNRTEESKIDDIYEKLELLTKLVNEAVQKQHDGSRSGFSKQDIKIVNDDDIIVSESQEFKHLQDQIDILKRKLLIKKENELRKLSLNKELIDLMEELNMNSSNTPNPLSRSTSEHHSEHYNHHKSNQQGYHNENSHPLHCEHCHVKSHSENHPPEPKFVNLKESLETPTPTPTQTPRKLRKENDNSVANKQYSLW